MRPDLAVMINLNGNDYLNLNEICTTLHVSRQTLWRWRRLGLIPLGRRFRDKELIFSLAELATIRAYAERITEVDSQNQQQINLI